MPIAATIAVSLFHPMLIERYLLFAVPGLAAVCVITAFSVKPRRLAVLAAVWLVAISATTGASSYALLPNGDWRDATVALTSRAQAGDMVVFNPEYVYPVYDYYVERLGLAGNAPARMNESQIERTWPPAVWIIGNPSGDASIVSFLATLKRHGYVLDGPSVSVPHLVARRFVLAKK